MNFKIFNNYIPLSPLILFGMILLISCNDQTIDPIEDESGIYSFYGTLKVGQTPNVVRIKNLSEPFLSEPTDFDAEITFKNLQTGDQSVLQDSVVEFSNNFTHNFILDDNIEHNTEYLLRAERSDGEIVESIATTPQVTDVSFFPNEDINCDTTLELTFGNVQDPEYLDLILSITLGTDIHQERLNIFIDEFQRNPEDNEMVIEMSPRNFLVEIFPPILPDNPEFNPYNLAPVVDCKDLTHTEIDIYYVHYGPEFANGRPFRGPVDIESGDVNNGLGFFGAYREDSFSISFNQFCGLC